jgi:hypothetical protein
LISARSVPIGQKVIQQINDDQDGSFH